jgi:hypothetical protein
VIESELFEREKRPPTWWPGRFAFADGSAVLLDEAERFPQAVEMHCGSNWAVALLEIKPTTLESRIKKLGSCQPVISEFSEVLRLFGEFDYTNRATGRREFHLSH